MSPLCKNCIYPGKIADSLQRQGWTGCRKMLEMLQLCSEVQEYSWVKNLSNAEIASELVNHIDCEDAVTGWVDTGPLGHPTGRMFNGVLMTKGTTACEYFNDKRHDTTGNQ